MNTLLAQVDLGQEFKLLGGQTISTTFGDGIRGFVAQILPNAFILAGLILLILAAAGGLKMITSAGNPEDQEKGKQTLTNAVIGFVLVFASFWIIQIIQVITGINILG